MHNYTSMNSMSHAENEALRGEGWTFGMVFFGIMIALLV